MLPALILFAATYVLMLVFSKYRPYTALGSAAVFIITGMLPLNEIIPNIDLNGLPMIAGTMGLVALFIVSRMPELLADLVMEKVPNVQWAAVALELGALLSTLILYWIFRKEKGSIEKTGQRTRVTDYVPTALLGGAILLLILASFLPEKPAITNGLICCGLLVAGLIYNYGKKKNIPAYIYIWMLYGIH